MSSLEKHIGNLTLGTDITPDPVVESATAEEGTFDGGDQLLDEIGPAPEIPAGIEDEQAEVFEQSSSKQEAKEEKEEEPADWRAKYEEAQKAADGRLGEIGSLRNKLSETNQSIEQLRQIFLAREKAEYEAQQEAEVAAQLEYEREVYGDEVVDDPAVAYMRDKWMETQEAIERQAQEQEGRRRALLEQSQQHRAQQQAFQQEVMAVKAQEDAFTAKHEDYPDAYEYARKTRVEMYQDMGYTPDQAVAVVRNEEAGLRQVHLSDPNGNVAEAIYNLAKRMGYQGKQKQEAAPKTSYKDQAPNFSKMKAGIGHQRAGGFEGKGGTGNGTSRRLSAEEFYNTVPIAQRLEIQADPDKFEELGRTGYITLD